MSNDIRKGALRGRNDVKLSVTLDDEEARNFRLREFENAEGLAMVHASAMTSLEEVRRDLCAMAGETGSNRSNRVPSPSFEDRQISPPIEATSSLAASSPTSPSRSSPRPPARFWTSRSRPESAWSAEPCWSASTRIALPRSGWMVAEWKSFYFRTMILMIENFHQ